MKTFLVRSIASLMILIGTTYLYTLWLYEAGKIDKKVVFNEYQDSFAQGTLLKVDYPALIFVGSRNNLDGLDQYTECFYAIMSTYQGEKNSWENALNPGFYGKKGDPPMCSQAFELISKYSKGTPPGTDWEIRHKPRLWHGVKAVLQTWFRYYHLSQLHWLIKLSTLFGFAVIGMLVMCHDRLLGFAFLAFTFSAFFCSSVLFFGGVAYSIPLLAVIFWLCLWLLFRLLKQAPRRTVELCLIVAGGTLNAFFYQLDGSLIFAVAMIFFVEIFMSLERADYSSVKRALESCLYYSVGFFGSIVFKHFAIALAQESFAVFSDLFRFLELRLSHVNSEGRHLSALGVINGQFYWYGVAAYGLEFLNNFVLRSRLVFLPLAGLNAIALAIMWLRGKKEMFHQYFVPFLGFMCMVITVLARYAIMQNHSDIHVFFVNRYLFVFAGTIYFYLIWILLQIAKNTFPQHFRGKRKSV